MAAGGASGRVGLSHCQQLERRGSAGPGAVMVARESEALRQRVKGVAPSGFARVARMRRAVGFAARAHGTAPAGRRPDQCVMVTATYAPGVEWAPEHVSEWLQRARQWLGRRGLRMRYVWVAEMQARGAVHYHLAVWLPLGMRLPKSDAAGWWPHGMTRTEVAERAVPYLMKYLSKGEAAKYPKGLRTYGVGGLEHSMRRAARWLRLPSFVQARADIFDEWDRAPGGGWRTPDGIVVPSEYVRAWLGDRWGCLRVVDYGRPFQAAGPFSWLHRGAQ